MDEHKLPSNPVRVSPASVASWLGAEITICEAEAVSAMARGDEAGALGMLARAGGLADAYALIAGTCRGCGGLVGQPHAASHCRSGGLNVGGIGAVDPTYCVDVAPARTFGSFSDMVRATGGTVEQQVWTPGGQA